MRNLVLELLLSGDGKFKAGAREIDHIFYSDTDSNKTECLLNAKNVIFRGMLQLFNRFYRIVCALS